MKLYLNPGILFDVKTLKKLLEQLCTQADVFPAPGEQAAQGHEAGGREGRRQALARDWAARLKACLDREHCEHLLTEEELGLLELLPALLARLNAESIVCQALPVTASWQETRGTDTDRQEARLVTLRLLCGHRIRLVEDSGTACTDVFPGVSLGAALVLGAFAGHGVSCEGLCGRLVAFAKVQTAEGGSAEGFLLDEKQEEAQKEEEEAGGGALAREEILQLETNVDHLTGEEIGTALQELAGLSGVLDVFWLSGIGKKNRPMGLLRLMCHRKDGAKVGAALLRQTHTLGYRVQLLTRCIVPRRKGVGALADGTLVAAKEYEIDGVWYCRPESDAVRSRAQEKHVGAPALRLAQVAQCGKSD